MSSFSLQWFSSYAWLRLMLNHLLDIFDVFGKVVQLLFRCLQYVLWWCSENITKVAKILFSIQWTLFYTGNGSQQQFSILKTKRIFFLWKVFRSIRRNRIYLVQFITCIYFSINLASTLMLWWNLLSQPFTSSVEPNLTAISSEYIFDFMRETN